MSISARIFLNTCVNTVFLRLCIRPCYTIGNACTRPVNIITKFSKNCTHINVYHNDTYIARAANRQMQYVERNEEIQEHEGMHMILENSKHYNRTIMSPIKARAQISSTEISRLYHIDWTIRSGQDILKAIKQITYFHLSGSSFEISGFADLLCGLSSKLPELSDVQIYMLMQCLVTLKTSINNLHINTDLLKALNKDCLARFFSKDRETLLLYSHAFYQLKDRNSIFLWRAIRKLATKPEKLSAKYLVQVLFLLNFARLGSVINTFEIELRVQECIHEMSINEIGIVARGLFLRQHSIRNRNLLYIIIKKTAQYAHMVQNIPLSSIMKLVRYSNCRQSAPEIQQLLISLRKEVPRLSLKSFTHISHAFGTMNTYDELLTKSIVERVMNEVADARLKDIERIIYGITTVTPSTKYYNDVCEALLKEVQLTYQTNRLVEIKKFPSSLPRILTFASAKSIYIPELLYFTFDPKYVRTIYKNNIKLLADELLTLHCSVQIDLPDYKGPLLEDDVYQYLIKKYSSISDMHNVDMNLQLKTEIVFIAKNKLGIDICIDYILPYYMHKDIIFGFDKYKNPVNVEPILSAIPTGYIKRVKNDELKSINWHTFLILSDIAKVFGHDGYIGNINRKIRHLRAIGYEPVLIDSQKWNSCSDELEKSNYLRQQINECENLSL